MLDALVELNTSDAIAARDLSHELEIPDDQSILTARFLLDEQDRVAIGHLPGGDKARWFVVAKRKGGVLATAIEPPLQIDAQPRASATDGLRRLLRTRWGSSLSRVSEEELGARLDALDTVLQAEGPLDEEARNGMRAIAADLRVAERAPKLAMKLGDQLDAIAENEPSEPPDLLARRILLQRRPEFLKFT